MLLDSQIKGSHQLLAATEDIKGTLCRKIPPPHAELYQISSPDFNDNSGLTKAPSPASI
jgi:hypothetical protein